MPRRPPFDVQWLVLRRDLAKYPGDSCLASALPMLSREGVGGLGAAMGAEKHHLSMSAPYCAALGHALVGRSTEAIATLDEALELAEKYNRANRSLFLGLLSEAHLDAGHVDDAVRVARIGLTGARERQERGEEA